MRRRAQQPRVRGRRVRLRSPHRASGAARARLALLLLGLAALITVVTSAPAASPQMTLSASAAPAELIDGDGLTVAGTLSDAGVGVAGVPVLLRESPYPFTREVTVGHAQTDSAGGYSFAGISLDRNTRMRVVLAAAAAIESPVLPVTVDPAAKLSARVLGPSRVRVDLRIRHTVHGGASGDVWWYVAAKGSSDFRVAAVTAEHGKSPGISTATATLIPSAQQFIYRVCVESGWRSEMGAPAARRPCPSGDFTATALAPGLYQGTGSARLLKPFPAPSAIAAAARYLDSRAGRTSFAVVDSRGKLSGLRTREHFQTASVIKVMFLVAYLQRLNAHHLTVSAADNALLYPMIHISDNDAASAVLGVVGEHAVERVAREAGMSEYKPGVGWWAYSQTSAADQASFFLALERMIPPQFYGYARGLMAGIEPEQSWGIPPIARPAWQIFFKTGALPSEGLFHEVSLLERPGLRITIAVFTDGDPSMAYGEQTIEGLGSILLAGAP